MTITFLAPDGVELSATRFRQAHAAQYGGGANRPLGGRSGFRVDTASDVFTATSTTWTLKPCAAMIDPGALTHQGMYGWSSDANITGNIDAADATLTRYDRVWIRLNDSTAGDVSGAVSANVEYQAGTAGAGVPIALPNRCFLVADITVPPAGGGSPTVALNPARFVSAGGILPIASQAAQDALSKYPASEIIRTDDKYKQYISDGTKWRPHADALGLMARTILNETDSTAVTTIASLGNRISSFDFKAGRKYRIGFEGNYYVSDTSAVLLLQIGTCAVSDSDTLTTGVTVLNQTDFQATSAMRGFPCNLSYSSYEPTADVTLKVKVLAQRIVGAGNIFFQRSPVTPATVFIEDLGAQF